MSRDTKKYIFHKCYSVVTKRFYADYSDVCTIFPKTRDEATFICWYGILQERQRIL